MLSFRKDALEYATVEIAPSPQSATRSSEFNFENARWEYQHTCLNRILGDGVYQQKGFNSLLLSWLSLNPAHQGLSNRKHLETKSFLR